MSKPKKLWKLGMVVARKLSFYRGTANPKEGDHAFTLLEIPDCLDGKVVELFARLKESHEKK